MLSLLIFLPIIGAILIAFVPKNRPDIVRWLALIVSVITLVISIPLYWGDFANNPGRYLFEEIYPWIPSFNIGYHVGVDGISVFLVILTTFLSVVSILSSWTAITEQVKESMALMLILQAAITGVFVSLDLFLFYLFWEASLIPMALLIGRWGGNRRVYASIKFFLYTMAGSALMLVAAIVVYVWGGTADLPTLVANL